MISLRNWNCAIVQAQHNWDVHTNTNTYKYIYRCYLLLVFNINSSIRLKNIFRTCCNWKTISQPIALLNKHIFYTLILFEMVWNTFKILFIIFFFFFCCCCCCHCLLNIDLYLQWKPKQFLKLSKMCAAFTESIQNLTVLEHGR